VSSRKFDAEDTEPPINGADHENGSASGSEYNSQGRKSREESSTSLCWFEKEERQCTSRIEWFRPSTSK
jgi:hypothetical protein